MVLQQAIMPKVSITDAIKNWDNIKIDLMESNRKRKSQSELLHAII